MGRPVLMEEGVDTEVEELFHEEPVPGGERLLYRGPREGPGEAGPKLIEDPGPGNREWKGGSDGLAIPERAPTQSIS